MGRKSTEIERDLERQRQSLHARVDDLEGRLRSDAESTRERLNERRDRITDTVPDQLSASEAGRHPKSLLLGAFGAGLTAGLVSDRGGGGSSRGETRRYDRYDEYDPYDRPRRREGEGGSFTLGLIDRTFGPAIATFQSEATSYIEDAVRDLFGSRERESRHRGESQEEADAESGATSRS